MFISILRRYDCKAPANDEADQGTRTFPTAASPSRTSLTLLLGFGGTAAESAMTVGTICRYAKSRA